MSSLSPHTEQGQRQRAYLERIGYRGSIVPNLETLRALQRAHLFAVPFENLDIHLQRPIVLDRGRLFAKVVEHRRGGFCYELNGLFSALLRGLGFSVELLSARVYGDGKFGPEFDHLTLLLHLEQPWLVDVGFPDGFREPLCLEEPGPQLRDGAAYRLEQAEAAWTLLKRAPSGEWETQYRFTLQPHRFEDFAVGCLYHQTSPDSFFTRGRLCTRPLPGGHITLSEHRLIVVEQGERREQPIAGPEGFAAALLAHFGMDMASL